MIVRATLRIFVAYLCAIVGTTLIAILITPVRVWLLPTDLPRGIYTELELIFLLAASILSYLWSGFIIAKISQSKEIFTAMSYSIFFALSWSLNEIDFPAWYITSQIIISFLFIYMGAKLHLRNTKKPINYSPMVLDGESHVGE